MGTYTANAMGIYTVNDAHKVIIKKLKQRGSGTKTIKAPPDKTITDLVRKGMALEGNAREVAKAVRLNKDIFFYVRRLIILSERTDVSEEDKNSLNKALALIDETRRLRTAKQETAAIVAKYWKVGTQDGYKKEPRFAAQARKKRKRFENTLLVIRDACANNEDMEIPKLTQQEINESAMMLLDCIIALSAIAERLKKD